MYLHLSDLTKEQQKNILRHSQCNYGIKEKVTKAGYRDISSKIE